MLEQVRETGAAARLVGRPDVIPEVDGHQRQAMILAQDHLEAVRQRVLLEGNRREAVRRGRRRLCPRDSDNEQRRCRDGEDDLMHGGYHNEKRPR